MSGARAGSAQCYEFSSGTAASLTLNVVSLPAPAIASDGSGGTYYDYSLGVSPLLNNGVGNTASLTVGTATYASSAPVLWDISIHIGSSSQPSTSLTVSVTLTGSSSTQAVGATISLATIATNLLPNGLPATLPSVSAWSVASLGADFGTQAPQVYFLTSITNCGGATRPPIHFSDFAGNGLSGALLYDPSMASPTPLSATATVHTSTSPISSLPPSTLSVPAISTATARPTSSCTTRRRPAAYIGFGNGDGTFNFQSLFWSPGYDTVETGDINGDGKTDVALYNSTTGTLYTGISNGDGTFTYQVPPDQPGLHVRSTWRTSMATGRPTCSCTTASDGLAYLGIGDGTGSVHVQSAVHQRRLQSGRHRRSERRRQSRYHPLQRHERQCGHRHQQWLGRIHVHSPGLQSGIHLRSPGQLHRPRHGGRDRV